MKAKNSHYLIFTDVLIIKKLDLCLKDNHKQHHTNYFSSSKEKALIVRRGVPFRLRLHFNRSYIPRKDILSFIFSVSDEKIPIPESGTYLSLVASDSLDFLGKQHEWGAAIEQNKDTECTVLIKPAASCPVTEWSLNIETKLKHRNSNSFYLKLPLYILFNPWCKSDQVYQETMISDRSMFWRIPP